MLTLQQRLAGLDAECARAAISVIGSIERGRVDEAEHALRALFARAPANPEVLRLAGMIHAMRGRMQPALAALHAAAEQRPDDAVIFNTLAGVYERVNDPRRAREALRRACELGPDFAPCWVNYGWRLFVDGEVDEAVTVLRHAVKLAPHDAQARTLLADALNSDGDSEAAAAQYRSIIGDNAATAAQAWWSLATLRPVRLDAADIETLRGLERDATIPDAERTTIGCALAIGLEHHGDFTGAFAALQAAHALARSAEPYDADAFSARVDSILAAFSPAPLQAASPSGEEAIFIVSMPRSGSTLTEQILASHSMVAGGAELNDLPELVREESERERQPFPAWVATHSAAQWQSLGQRYLERTARWRRTRPRFTDKMPLNWLHVGAILAMLPQARVIVVRRDPLETCLACYRYMFRRHPYTHVFADLAQRWRDFDRATRHWCELHPGRVREQSYEALLAEPEAQIRDLLAFCNLPFESACLNFHSTERRVTTPSAAQVREPMRRDTARAANYGALLDPLRKALGMPPFATQ